MNTNFEKNILNPMIEWLSKWKIDKEKEGMIPTVELLIEELKSKKPL